MRALRAGPKSRRARTRTGRVLLSALGLSLATQPVHGGAVGRAAEGERGPVRVEMEEVEIEGAPDWPDVFYIIPRREVELDLGPLSRDYTEEILVPLVPGPFERWVQEQRGSGKTGPRPP